MTFEKIKKHFDNKRWTAQHVAVAVHKGVITAAQYKQITGQNYTG